MKLMNSKDIGKILEKDSDLFNDELMSPCWQAFVDRENDLLLFLIDDKEVLRVPLSCVDGKITVEKLTYYIQFLREDRIKELSKELRS